MPGQYSIDQLSNSGALGPGLYDQLFAGQDFTGIGEGYNAGNSSWYGPGEFLGEAGWSQGPQTSGFQGSWAEPNAEGDMSESGEFVNSTFNPSRKALDSYKGYTFNYKPGEDGAATLEAFNPQGTLANTYNQRGQTGINKAVTTVAPILATMAFGGALAPLLGGGALGAMGGNALASGGMTGMRGGSLGQIGSSMLSSALSSGMGSFNPAGQLGLSGTLGNMFNSGVGGAANTALKGGSGSDILTSGLQGSLVTGMNNVGNSMSNTFGDLWNSFSGGGGDDSGMSFEYAQPNNDMSLGDYAQPEDQSFSFDQSVPTPEWSSPAVGMKTMQSVEQPSSFADFSMPGNMGASVGNFLGSHGGDLASMLYGFYNNKKQQKALQGQQEGLAGLYSQNSPYAQQLRNNLQAKAAAGGKRLNTSGREVQLQAALADRAAQMAPAMYQMQQGQNSLQNNNMNMLLQGANKMGAFKALNNGLQGMFGSSPVMQNNQPFQNYFGDYNSLGGQQ